MENRTAPKIVQLSSAHPSFDTRIFHKICRSLADHGYDVDLIIQHDKDEFLSGINILSLPIAHKKSDRVLKVIPALFRKCISYPPNTVFHFHDPELLPVGIFLKKAGYKVIYDVHEDVPEDIKSKQWIPAAFRSILSWLVAAIEKYAKEHLDAVIVVTKKIGERLESPRMEMVQNFPILSELPNSERDFGKRNSVFYLGDITRIRGLFENIRAVELANNESEQELRFILGGKFSPPRLKKELEREPGWQFVDFKGWISREDLIRYAGMSFAGLVTFHPEPNHIEAQPNKLFEYMYCGLPVIASDFPLWREIVNSSECGLLVDPLNAGQIAEAIQYLKNNPEEAMQMGKNGRKAVLEKYNWTAEEKSLLSIYRKLS